MFNQTQGAFDVWKIKDFRLFLSARFFLTMAIQMQSVIIGWQIYDLTKDPLSLGIIGLAEAIPFLGAALFAGNFADRRSRKQIILFAVAGYVVCAVFLMFLTINQLNFSQNNFLLFVYLIIGFSGIIRAFIHPAHAALMAQLVPRTLYVNSSTWNSTIWHIAAVSGPACGGLVYGFFGVQIAWLLVLLLSVISFVLFLNLKRYSSPERAAGQLSFFRRIGEGIKFTFQNQIILGAISLDMFAVLFGGAVAMLPVFAKDVLHTGPQGLGLLRAAPALGAIVFALYLAYHPPLINAGKKLLLGVAGFGACIILFALSENFLLSFMLLFFSGAFDNVSVIIRHSLLQLYTPDEMRGRVASVNSIFIGSSNELGSFESGVAARLMGLIPSVIFGGSMTLLIVGITAKLAPTLRKLSIKATH